MKRVLFVVLVSLGPMVLGDDLSSSSRRAVANGFYVWQRHWSTKVESALDAELATGTYDLYVLGGELDVSTASAPWRGADVPSRLWCHPHVTAVFRLPVQTLDHPVTTAARVVARAKALNVWRIQLDVDVPERRMERYVELVETIRRTWPTTVGPLSLGATFLPCHLDVKDTRRVLALLDEPVTGRFHYRRVALKSIFSAVQLAKDVDVRAWALMCGGVVALSLDDVQTADWFHKKFAVLHHPSARIEGNWFTKSPAYWRMKEKYYDAERHHQPLRVPPRLTKEQFKHLYTPERP